MFGLKAAARLGDATSASITLVDREAIAETDTLTFIQADGAAWLAAHLTRTAPVTKIIPAVPFHLAAFWLMKKLGTAAQHQLHALPARVCRQFPNPFTTADNSVVMSYADFICPDDCPEPEGFCTYTGLPRPEPLYSRLHSIDCEPYPKLILRSRQFAPGVGGFYPADLWNLLDQARLYPGRSILVATACKCHGVASLIGPAPDDREQRRQQTQEVLSTK